LQDIAAEKGISLVESEAIVDHVHLLLRLDRLGDLPRTMMLLKGVSARRIFEEFPELKLDAQTQSLWESGYGSRLVSESKVATVRRYIATQWERLEDYDASIRPISPRMTKRQ
jgi:putative transposase